MQQSIATGRTFDVILMDSIMPRMSGPEATRVIRTQLRYHGSIIGVTGNVLAEDIEDFKRHGADAVLGKPLKLRELFTQLECMTPDQYKI